MADTDVGKQGTYHGEDGDVPCWVIDYVAGRPEGDHLVGGFEKVPGKGDTFRHWTVVGKDTGAFSLHK